jgi:enoyl-CoA hydratase/carnithine racemase
MNNLDSQGRTMTELPEAPRVEITGGVAILTLDNPKQRNALSALPVNEITSALVRLENDEQVCAVVVTGAPPGFAPVGS